MNIHEQCRSHEAGCFQYFLTLKQLNCNNQGSHKQTLKAWLLIFYETETLQQLIMGLPTLMSFEMLWPLA